MSRTLMIDVARRPYAYSPDTVIEAFAYWHAAVLMSRGQFAVAAMQRAKSLRVRIELAGA